MFYRPFFKFYWVSQWPNVHKVLDIAGAVFLDRVGCAEALNVINTTQMPCL